MPRPRPPSSWTPLAETAGTLADLAFAALALLLMIDAWAPPQDLAWKPLRLAEPLGLATRVKFARAAADPALCRAVLAEGGVRFTEAPDRPGQACATPGALRLGAQDPGLSPPAPTATCALALGYAFWTRHAVQPAAHAHLGSPVVRVDHFGTYACRNTYGRSQAPLSQHASANAIDVAGFRTAAGQRLTIARDFRRRDAQGRFLRQVRLGACDWFRVVLGPDYNAAHRDHLHLDQGPYRACR